MKSIQFAGSIILGSLLAISGCGGKNTSQTKLQYMPDMADSPTVKAQENMLSPPEHSVPYGSIIYPESFEVAEKEFQNPITANDKDLAEGARLYGIFCTVCHGADGKGQGTMGASYPTPPPDITREDLAKRGDGFFFMKISQGGPIMPRYGHATDTKERWQIILHLRTLQKK